MITRTWVCEDCEGPAAPCIFIMVNTSDNEEHAPTKCPENSEAHWKPAPAPAQDTDGGSHSDGGSPAQEGGAA